MLQPHVWSRALAASWKVFGHLRPSELSLGACGQSGEGFTTCPEGSSLKASAQGRSLESQNQGGKSFRRSEERRWSTSKVKNRTKDLAEREPGLEETE